MLARSAPCIENCVCNISLYHSYISCVKAGVTRFDRSGSAFECGVPLSRRPLIEYGRFSSVREDPKSEVQVDRARQDYPLQIAPFADQIVDRITVTDSHDVLFDDGPVIQLLGNVVTRGADELDAPVIRLVVGARTNKRRKKRVVNINDPVGIPACELRTQYLHVPGQHDQIDLIAFQQLQFFLLLFLLILGADGKYVERNAKTFWHELQIQMVADHE